MKTFIIAEAGVNHNGSLDMALKLVEKAAKAGADAVKFQTFKTEKTISRVAEKADYQKQSTGSNESQLEMVKKLELSYEDFKKIKKHCVKYEIMFLSTGFDYDSLNFLNDEMAVPMIKLPSGDINNAPLVLQAARTKKDILLSTGMSTIQDIHNALAIIYYGYMFEEVPRSFEEVYNIYEEVDKSILKDKVTLLQCTTEYPTPVEDINLRAIHQLSEEFGLRVGFSDHSKGIDASMLAVALGATVIEKHFTLDNNMVGPDHQASLNPSDFASLVKKIRYAEIALGEKNKFITNSERKNIEIARKSLIANQTIKKGDYFTIENLIIKRPAKGVNPLKYWDYIGQIAQRDYEEDELI